MPTLADYDQFAGAHWETGTVRNHYAYRGVVAPHTGEPYSEALLLGVSGGLVFGYFNFIYQGMDPQCNLLTRNTFDPWDTMLSRLGVVQDRIQTASAARATQALKETLESGVPAIVWADMWSLPYNGLTSQDGMWWMAPVLVYGYEEDAGAAYLADRAQVPLKTTTDALAAARGRVKKDKHRLITLASPEPAKLAAAVRAGIWDTIRLFTEKPPKGSKNNFGLAAYRFWAKNLSDPRARLSWEKQFPAGLPMVAGLTSAYEYGFLFGKGEAEDGERGMYADFLGEAAVILDAPGLSEAAASFREAGAAWGVLAQALLPDGTTPFGETRALMRRRHQLFLAEGNASLAERTALSEQLATLRQQISEAFPLGAATVTAHRERIADAVMAIHDVEARAIEQLRDAMA
jgi:hypothetical protein